MDLRSLGFVAQACEAERLSGPLDGSVRRVCTDSRDAREGDLFIALQGERFDGHDFLAEVAAKKVTAMLVQRGREVSEFPGRAVLAVDDTRKAFGRLAARYRRDYSCPIIAVAGSNGKTTTKELIAAVMREKHRALWSEASFNNEIGVPATLLRLERTHQVAVLEAGTNHPGELAPLVGMIAPTHGVITSIGREHLEFFGDMHGVVEEEGWLAALLPPEGKLFIHGDDTWADTISSRSKAAVQRVGLGDRNDWRARMVRLDKDGVSFRVEAPVAGYAAEYHVNLLGRHQAVNALFAIALGCDMGLSCEDIQKGLSKAQPARMRLQLVEANGVRILNDAYNANADSMAVALRTLQDLPCSGRRVAVLGEMAELGGYAEAAHEEVGRRVAESGVGQLFAVGKMASVLARGARQAGLNRVLEFADVESAAKAVRSFVRSGDVLLLKASRIARLERLADLLRTN